MDAQFCCQADRAARMSSWSDEEKRLLEKALTKFPVVRKVQVQEQSLHASRPSVCLIDLPFVVAYHCPMHCRCCLAPQHGCALLSEPGPATLWDLCR